MSFRPRGLGYLPSPPDPRDRIIERPLSALALPREFSLRDHVVEVLDQGSVSSCVANAVAQAVRMTHHRQGITKPLLASRMAIYYLARAYSGNQKSDSGTYIRDAFASLRGFGFCAESWCPYYVERVNLPPPWRALQMSGDQRKASYGRIIATGDELVLSAKQRLVMGQPIVFGTDVGSDFVNDTGTRDVVYAPQPHQVVGGHAMCIIGYRSDGAFEVVNSWGKNWGIDGFCWMAPEYLGNPMTRDLWTILQVPPYSDS